MELAKLLLLMKACLLGIKAPLCCFQALVDCVPCASCLMESTSVLNISLSHYFAQPFSARATILVNVLNKTQLKDAGDENWVYGH